MQRRELAKRLVTAGTDRERRRLLCDNPELNNSKVARDLKDICYSSWTSEPVIARKTAAALRILAKQNGEEESNAIASWIDGISKITQGKFEQAVEKFNEASKVFGQLGKQMDAAQTQVARLIALAMLGRYQDADEAGRSALSVFELARDHLAAGKIEMNLSNIAARREMHREAERYALSALRRFKKSGESTWQTMAENDLANTYSEINDFRRAEKYFALAARSAKAAKMRLTQAEIEASIGNLEMFRGRYAGALRYFELSRQKYEELSLPHQTAIAELEIAEIYAELDLVNEALSMLAGLVGRLRKLRLKADEARARTTYARLLTRQAAHRKALKELRHARLIYSKEDNSIGQARTDILRAEIMIRTLDYRSAETVLEQALDLLKTTGNKRLRITAEWMRAEVKRLCDNHPEARRLLKALTRRAKNAELPGVTVAALTSLGKLESAVDDTKAAKSAFRKAATIIEGMRAPIASDEFRMSFLASQLEPFNELFRIAVKEGRIEEAFKMHESVRARSLVDAIDIGPIRISNGKLNNKLNKKLSDVREELNWFYSRLARAETADTASFESEIESREKQITKLTRQLDSLGTKGDGKVNRFDLSRLRKQLKNDMALVEYANLDGVLAAFVVTSGSVELVEGLGTESEIKTLLQGLRFQFGTLKFGAAATQNFLPQLKRNADQYFFKLRKILVSPLEHLIDGKRLVLAPVGVLNYIPFNALFDGESYLIQKHSVSITPSAQVWQTLQQKRRAPSGKGLLIGYSDESIPLADAEVKHLKRISGIDAIALTGRNATFRAFVENAPKADLIHLACHGQFRSDNPMYSSLHLSDGWVTVRDIAKQKLKARLVTLSACETGLSEVHKGEELLGLTRGFLSAGARNLIVSLWTVNDESTSQLMSDLYTNLQLGHSPAASLRSAQLRFIASDTHPYYWSPFVSIGT